MDSVHSEVRHISFSTVRALFVSKSVLWETKQVINAQQQGFVEFQSDSASSINALMPKIW